MIDCNASQCIKVIHEKNGLDEKHVHACTSFFVFLYGKDKMSKTLNKQSYSELYPLKIAVKWNSNNIGFYNMYKTMGMHGANDQDDCTHFPSICTLWEA